MNTPAIKKVSVILAHGIVGWGLCGSIIVIGQRITSLDNSLIAQAIGAPIIFGIISWSYFKKFHYTAPLLTAEIFLITSVWLDLLIIAPVVEKSYAMFSNILGVWIPFVLIFLSSYLVGRAVMRSDKI